MSVAERCCFCFPARQPLVLWGGEAAPTPSTPPSSRPSWTAAVTEGAAISKCVICGEPLDGGEVVVISDEDSPLKGQIHAECFICCVCEKPLDGPFAEHKGKLFCEDHYKEFVCETCPGCGQKLVSGKVVNALGSQWHADCFACAACNTPLAGEQGTQFEFAQHDEKIYCAPCYKANYCQKCKGCGFAIIDNGLEALGACWHRECFVCTECRQPLAEIEDGTFAVIDGRPFCVQHAEAIGRLSPQERSLLQKLPKPSESDHSRKKKLTPADYGGCLSQGLHEVLKAEEGQSSAGSASLPRTAFHAKPQWTLKAGSEGDIPFHFAARGPEAFDAIRTRVFDIKPEEFRNSLCLRPLTGGNKGEGKSGMLFYFSWDYKYIVKTISQAEATFFGQCLQDYYTYLISAPRMDNCTASLLPRYLGLFTAKFSGHQAMNFIVMSNVFPPRVKMLEQYDIKGVLGKQRFVSPEEMAKGVKVLKDRNFAQRPKLAVGRSIKVQLDAQLGRDIQFLLGHDRMDYSLLLGVAERAAVEEPGSKWPAVENGGLLSRDLSQCEVYFMGIIDVLQEYNWRKAIENHVKTVHFRAMHVNKRASMRNADNAVSAATPSHYAERFREFVNSRLE